MIALEKATGLQVNRVKSGMVASHTRLIASMEGAASAMGLKVKKTLKDLGIVHGKGTEASAKRGERWLTATERMKRIGSPFRRGSAASS